MKNKKLTDTNYLFLSATVACLENTLIQGELLDKMIEARSFEESFGIAAETFSERGEIKYGADGYEKVLSDELFRAYSEIEKLLVSAGGETRLLRPMRYLYDCQNIKSCIKCEALGISPEEMFISCGNIPSPIVLEMVNKRDFSELPFNMRTAAEKAIEEFSVSGDPQKIDLILDRGAFLDMSETADEIGLEYLSMLCRTKIDLCNIMSFVRCMLSGIGLRFFREAFIPGGTLEEEFFVQRFGEGTDKLFSAMASSGLYGAFYEKAGKTPGSAEKLCDEIYLKAAFSGKFVSFGPEKAIMYMIEKENEIRNVRIVLAGKKSGLSSEKLRERIRVSPQ